jgi:hypothetical protein
MIIMALACCTDIMAHIYVSNTFILLGCFIGYSPQKAMAQNMKSNLVTETALSNDSNQTPQ